MIDLLTISVMASLMLPTAPLVCSMPQSPEQEAAQAMEAVEEIIEDHQTAYQKAVSKYRAAETDAEREAIFETMPNSADLFSRLREIAEAHRKTEAASQAAQWVLSQNSVEGDWALQMLLEDFIDTEKVVIVARNCESTTSANVAILERIRKESTNDRARAVADYIRGTQLIMMSYAAQDIVKEGSTGNSRISHYMGRMDDELKTKLSASGMADECQRAGVALLAHCQEAYTEIELYKDSGLMISTWAEKWLFEINNLQIGDAVPDIEGVDAEGIAFKLSDYKGQVVVIDFWGFWCPPCRAMIPDERSLVKKLENKPFAFLGVNSDTREAYDSGVESMGVTWRSFMQGNISSPIHTKWNITSWPTIFVIDANGIIRFKNVRNEAMEEAVMTLLEELEGGP